MADDAEALKHEFFFRGFFKKRGFYNLKEVTPDQYRSDPYFNSQRNQRAGLSATDAFGKDSNGNEVLSATGEQEIDQVIGTAKDSVIGQQIVVEGYSNQPSLADEMAASRSRSLIVAHYLEKRFHLSAKNIAVMPLNATAPRSSGKDSWDGACIVLLASMQAPNDASQILIFCRRYAVSKSAIPAYAALVFPKSHLNLPTPPGGVK